MPSDRSLGLLMAVALLPFTGSAQTVPEITLQPSDKIVSLGDTVKLSVSATASTPIEYTWKLNGSPVPDATQSSLTLTNIGTAEAGSYTVTLSTADGSVTSDPASVEVNTRFRIFPNISQTGEGAASIAWGDYDDDGYPDFAASSWFHPQLYHNNGDGTVTQLPDDHIVHTNRHIKYNLWNGLWADVNNDGNLDLYAPTGGGGSAERDLLFLGTGGGNFEKATRGSLTTDTYMNLHAAFGDFDSDGILDTISTRQIPVNGNYNPSQQVIYWGKSDGTYTRVFGSSFASDSEDKHAAGIGIADLNNDGKPDVFFCTGEHGPMAYMNEGNRKFRKKSLRDEGNGAWIFSAAASDYDNDGDLDIFVAYGNATCELFRNDSHGNFENVYDIDPVLLAGRSTMAAWGDYDNDGWLDLFLPRTGWYAGTTNGGVEEDADQNDFLFRNKGDGTFEAVDAGTLTTDEWHTNGGAWADYDNDGFLDLAVGMDSLPPRLYRNEALRNGNTNAWMLVKLIGRVSNRSAYGARVYLKSTIKGQSMTQMREIGTGAGFGQNDLRAHFGMCDASVAESIEIRWPSGKTQSLNAVPARQILTLVEPGGPVILKTRAGTEIQIEADAETDYVLEASPDLNSWTALPDLGLRTDSRGKASLPLPANNSQQPSVRFFRARTL